MITKKQWNSLPFSKRRQIVKTFYFNMGDEFKNDMSQEFHHDFSWEGEKDNYQEGRWYKLLFSHLFITKDNKVKLVIYM